MNKKIIIHPCKNQEEMLRIAMNYISEKPEIKCNGNGNSNSVFIANPIDGYKVVGSVMETKVSIIFRGQENEKNI